VGFVAHKRFMIVAKLVDYLAVELAHDDGYDMYADGSAVTLANLMFLVGPVLGDPAAFDAMLSTFVDALRPSRPTTLDDLFTAFEPAACAARCPPTASSRSRAPAAGIPETQLGVRLLFSADLADRSMRRPAATPAPAVNALVAGADIGIASPDITEGPATTDLPAGTEVPAAVESAPERSLLRDIGAIAPPPAARTPNGQPS
jgi:hypothetical protein